MPTIVSQGYTPMSVAGFMDLRNKILKKRHFDQFLYDCFDSGDGIIYEKDSGKIKINLDSMNLRNLAMNCKLDYFSKTPDSHIYPIGAYALNLEKEKGATRFADLPEEINGTQLSFTHQEIKEYTNKALTDKQALKNKFLLALARGDKERLGNYVQNTYSRFNKPRLLGVLVSWNKSHFEAERHWSLSSIDRNNIYSHWEGTNGPDISRFLGTSKKLKKY